MGMPLKSGLSSKLTILGIVSFVFLWYWIQPLYYHQAEPSVFIPKKLYDPDAQYHRGQLVTDHDSDPKNTPPPSIPSFRTSSERLPRELYDPYPEYNGSAWRKRWKGTYSPCQGPRGRDVRGNADDMLTAYLFQSQAPPPMFGSFEETGLDYNYCFDRHSRFEPYGYDGNDVEGKADEPVFSRSSAVVWKDVNWGELQRQCFARNEDRYEPFRRPNSSMAFWRPTVEDVEGAKNSLILPLEKERETKSYRLWQSSRQSYKRRSALVFRTWDGNEWSVDTIQYVRSEIMELSLHSGAEYEVIVLVEVRDITIPIFEDSKAYMETVLRSVPEEFQNITILFNRELLEQWYPKAPKHAPVGSQTQFMHQPMQLLSLLRPDIDYFWQSELDVRFTGNHYHFLETISAFALAEPRRLQWERASRYYVPSVHGSWQNYTKLIANVTEGGGIWGPQRTTGIIPIGPQPPFEFPEEDDFQWGVGEEADFINIAPVFDTIGSEFLFKNSKDNYPDGPKTPAHATATTPLIRESKVLLRAMHHGQVNMGAQMFPEMYPESTALHHGLKISVFPLPMYLDYVKSPQEIDQDFNKDEGKDVLNVPYKYMDIWHRMTYWSTIDDLTTYPTELYKRWMGYGEKSADRLCLPGIMLHPVKGV